jgi:acetyl esterase
VYIHGGGFIGGSVDLVNGLCEHIVETVGVLVVSVDYRLAPEHPFPAAPEDAYAALRWLFAPSAAMGVDPSRIAVRRTKRGRLYCRGSRADGARSR